MILDTLKKSSPKPFHFQKIYIPEFVVGDEADLHEITVQALPLMSSKVIASFLIDFYWALPIFLRNRSFEDNQNDDTATQIAKALLKYLERRTDITSPYIYGYVLLNVPIFEIAFGKLNNTWKSLNRPKVEEMIALSSITTSQKEQERKIILGDPEALQKNREKRESRRDSKINSGRMPDRSPSYSRNPNNRRDSSSVQNWNEKAARAAYRAEQASLDEAQRTTPSGHNQHRSPSNGRPRSATPAGQRAKSPGGSKRIDDLEILSCKPSNCPGEKGHRGECLKCGYLHPTHRCWTYYNISTELCRNCDKNLYHVESECLAVTSQQDKNKTHPARIEKGEYVPAKKQ